MVETCVSPSREVNATEDHPVGFLTEKVLIPSEAEEEPARDRPMACATPIRLEAAIAATLAGLCTRLETSQRDSSARSATPSRKETASMATLANSLIRPIKMTTLQSHAYCRRWAVLVFLGNVIARIVNN